MKKQSKKDKKVRFMVLLILAQVHVVVDCRGTGPQPLKTQLDHQAHPTLLQLAAILSYISVVSACVWVPQYRDCNRPCFDNFFQALTHFRSPKSLNSFLNFFVSNFGWGVYCCLNNNFQYLNNITRISIYFFTYTYFHKTIITLL